MSFPAFRFDGRQAEATPILLRVDGGHLIVETTEGAELEREPLARIAVSEPLSHAPRLLALPSGETLEVFDADGAFGRALEHAGVRLPPAVRLQGWWPGVLVALAAIVGLLAAGYFKALPAAARWVAFALPAHVEARIGDQVLAVLDQHHFKRSRLGPERQAHLSRRFAAAAAQAAPGVPYRLEFRTTADNAINAVTLPGGIIVLLDGLVGFADVEEVLGVLGHELGHAVHKHSTRAVLQSVGLGALAGLLWGDFSGAAASVPVALAVLRYSRAAELEADDFAVAFLRTQGLSARPLYEFFSRMLTDPPEGHAEGIPDFLSSHPSLEERLARLRDRM